MLSYLIRLADDRAHGEAIIKFLFKPLQEDSRYPYALEQLVKFGDLFFLDVLESFSNQRFGLLI